MDYDYLFDLITSLLQEPVVSPDQLSLTGGGDRAHIKLATCEDYNAWLLYWPQGVHRGLHDHGDSAAAYSVILGTLRDARPSGSVDRIYPGDINSVDVGVIHDVWAESEWALSIHVYSPPLREMNFYEQDGSFIEKEMA